MFERKTNRESTFPVRLFGMSQGYIVRKSFLCKSLESQIQPAGQLYAFLTGEVGDSVVSNELSKNKQHQ